MKDYSVQNTQAKRYVQNQIFASFSHVDSHELTALAGNHPRISKRYYRKHLSSKHSITLVDREKSFREVIKADILDISPTSIMDVDLEVSIVSGAETIKQVFNNMDACISGVKALCFTVSTRCEGGRERTLEWLNQYLYDETLEVYAFEKEHIGIKTRYVQKVVHKQSRFIDSKLYCYKDSSQMMSGIIVWKWYKHLMMLELTTKIPSARLRVLKNTLRLAQTKGIDQPIKR